MNPFILILKKLLPEWAFADYGQNGAVACYPPNQKMDSDAFDALNVYGYISSVCGAFYVVTALKPAAFTGQNPCCALNSGLSRCFPLGFPGLEPDANLIGFWRRSALSPMLVADYYLAANLVRSPAPMVPVLFEVGFGRVPTPIASGGEAILRFKAIVSS